MMIAAVIAALALGAAPADAAKPAATSAPSPEAQMLARRVAARDDFLVMIESVAGGQVGEVEKGMGELTADQKTRVDQIGKQKLAEGIDRVVGKLAVVYARNFSVDDLRAIDAFLQTPAGRTYSERLLPTLMAVGEAMKGFDFKREVRAQACTEIKKGCADASETMKMPPPVKEAAPKN